MITQPSFPRCEGFTVTTQNIAAQCSIQARKVQEEMQAETTPTTSQIFLQLPNDLRDQLKNPLGNVISDNDPNKENIIRKISAESVLITVGDRTTENMLQLGLKPQVQIIDGLEKRNQRIVPADDTVNTNLPCRNQPGE